MSLAPRLLLATQFLSEGSGGIAEVARMTAKSLNARVPVRALACQDREDFRVGDVPVRTFRNQRLRFVAAFALASRKSTHIVHDFVGTARAQAFAWSGGKRNAIWAHGIEIWGDLRPSHLKAIRRADLILVNSAYTLARAERALKEARNVRLCRLGTTTDQPMDTTPSHDGPPSVLLLGRIDPLFPKGHDLLISIWPDVVSAVPGARLIFAGGGPALRAARDLAQLSRAAGQIDVLGFAPPEKLEDVWRRATVFAMPSLEEGFGLVFIEAMRRGLPVVASLSDAGQEINQHGRTGFNIDRNDPAALTEAIVALLRDRDEARRLGAAGRELWRETYGFSSFDARLQAAMADFFSA